jgi:guanylate kinase
VHGNRYGTLRDLVANATGKTVVLEIDIQGARSVRRLDPNALLIFIEPPSWAVLEERLIGRRTDPPDVIERRLANAQAELEAAAEFDQRVVNEDLEGAIDQVLRILDATSPPAAGGTPL